MQKCENCQNRITATRQVARGNVTVHSFECAGGYRWEDYDVPPLPNLITPEQATVWLANNIAYRRKKYMERKLHG